MTTLAAVLSPDPPWTHEVPLRSADEVLASVHQDAATLLVRLDGRRMRTVDSLFAEYARNFVFPAYFGQNWPAFDECLGDLSWLPSPSYTTIIDNAEQVLADDPGDRATYLRLIEGIGRNWGQAVALGPEWNGGDVPFNTILVSKRGNARRWPRWNFRRRRGSSG